MLLILALIALAWILRVLYRHVFTETVRDGIARIDAADRPTAKETAWMVGGYIGMWIIGDFIEQSRWNQKLLRDLDSRVAAIEKQNKK